MLQVNIDGAISFSSAVPTFTPTAFPLDGKVLIAPYWADSNTRGGVTVWYIETILPLSSSQGLTQIRDAFPANNFNATRLFIASWLTVTYSITRTDLVYKPLQE